jgi:hypothetical protein
LLQRRFSEPEGFREYGGVLCAQGVDMVLY